MESNVKYLGIDLLCKSVSNDWSGLRKSNNVQRDMIYGPFPVLGRGLCWSWAVLRFFDLAVGRFGLAMGCFGHIYGPLWSMGRFDRFPLVTQY